MKRPRALQVGFSRDFLNNDGMAMMVVTHEMGFASRGADRDIFMNDDRIEEDGTEQEFIETPRGDRANDFLSKILSY